MPCLMSPKNQTTNLQENLEMGKEHYIEITLALHRIQTSFTTWLATTTTKD